MDGSPGIGVDAGVWVVCDRSRLSVREFNNCKDSGTDGSDCDSEGRSEAGAVDGLNGFWSAVSRVRSPGLAGSGWLTGLEGWWGKWEGWAAIATGEFAFGAFRCRREKMGAGVSGLRSGEVGSRVDLGWRGEDGSSGLGGVLA